MLLAALPRSRYLPHGGDHTQQDDAAKAHSKGLIGRTLNWRLNPGRAGSEATKDLASCPTAAFTALTDPEQRAQLTMVLHSNPQIRAWNRAMRFEAACADLGELGILCDCLVLKSPGGWENYRTRTCSPCRWANTCGKRRVAASLRSPT